jgi:hypothetical protein
MNPTTRPAELERWYSPVTDWYDLDAYATEQGMDRLGLWTPAYQALITADLDVMAAYNEARNHASSDTRAGWLAKFVRVAETCLWIAVLVAPLLAL